MISARNLVVFGTVGLLSGSNVFGQSAVLPAPPSPQAAASRPTPVRLLLSGALSMGGDRIAEVYFTNGSSQSVRAGQGIAVAVGGEWQVPALPKLLVRTTVGFKYVTTAADDAHIRLTRVPLQLTAHWLLTERFSLGGGLATHRNIQFKADGIGPDLAFKGATGPTFEVAYRGIGLQYTAMRYTDQNNQTYQANALGLAFTAVLPRRR